MYQDVFIDHVVRNEKIKLKREPTLKYENNQKAFELLEDSINKHKFTWTQIYFNSNSEACSLKEQVRSIVFA